MSTADYNTEIRINGDREELVAIQKVLKFYCVDKREQYYEKNNCPYLYSAEIGFLSDKYDLKIQELLGNKKRKSPVRLDDWKLIDLLSSENIETLPVNVEDTLCIDAEGPYGYFQWLDEVKLFIDMAKAAPSATFSGYMYGYDGNGSQRVTAKLKNGLLYLNTEEDDEGKVVSYKKVYDPVVKKYLTNLD